MKTTKSGSFVKIGLIYTLSNVIIKGMAYLTTPIFTRIMSQAEYGSFSSISSWANIISIVVTLSLFSSISRAKYDYKNDMEQYMSTITILGSLFTLVAWGIFEISMGFWEGVFNMNRLYIRSIMLYSLFMPAIQTLITKHRMYGEYRRVVGLTWVTLIVTTAAALLLTFLLADKLTGRVLGTYAVVAVVDVVFWVYVVVKGKKFSLKMCKYALILSLPLLVHELSGVILNSSDNIIIKQICGEEAAALYSIAYTIAMLLTVLLSSVNQAWVPWFFDKLNEDDVDSVKKVVPIYITVFTIGCVALMLIGPEMILIFGGASYAEAVYVIPPICFSIELQFVYTLYVNVEFYLKKNLFISIATFLAAGVNIALNYWLIPIFGYVAAAYTTVIGYFCAMMFHYIVCSRTKYKKLFNVKVLAINILACLVAMVGITFLYTVNIARLILIAVIAVAAVVLLIVKRKSVFGWLKSAKTNDSAIVVTVDSTNESDKEERSEGKEDSTDGE